MTSALLILAGLMGAGGVGLAAAAAHGTSAAGLDSAAYLLLFHAIAVLAAASLSRQELLWPPLGLVAMACFVAGGALFAGDVSMRAFAGQRLFPMAAPAGGTLLILVGLSSLRRPSSQWRRRGIVNVKDSPKNALSQPRRDG